MSFSTEYFIAASIAGPPTATPPPEPTAVEPPAESTAQPEAEPQPGAPANGGVSVEAEPRPEGAVPPEPRDANLASAGPADACREPDYEIPADTNACGRELFARNRKLFCVLQAAPVRNYCRRLGITLANEANTAERQAKQSLVLDPLEERKAVEPQKGNTSGPTATLGQLDSAATGKTVALGSGTLTIGGSSDGASTVGAASINLPGLVAAAREATADNVEEYAVSTRAFDLAVLVPADLGSQLDLRFIGFRAKVDIVGAILGNQLATNVSQRWTQLTDVVGRLGTAFSATLESTMSAGGDVHACSEALVSADQGRVAQSCTGAPDLRADFEALTGGRRELDKDVEAWRARATAGYGGVELIADIPLEGREVPLDGSEDEVDQPLRLVSYLTGGYRDNKADHVAKVGFQARVGASYLDLAQRGESYWGVVGGLSLTLDVTPKTGTVHLTAGLEGRAGQEGMADFAFDPAVEGDYLDFVGGISVPLGKRAGFSVGARVPVAHERDDRGPDVFVNLDWAQLLAGKSKG